MATTGRPPMRAEERSLAVTSGARRVRVSRRRTSGPVGFLLPAAALLVVLSVLPLVQLVRMSFSRVDATSLNGIWELSGWENYRDGFASGVTQAALGRTLVFVLIVTVVGLVVGAGAAVAMRTSTKPGGVLLALMVFIWALPPVVNGSVWKFLFADRGLVNSVITGLGGSEVPFLYDQNLALYSVALVNAWAVIPFNVLVYRAAILNISDEVFEAARLDGASAWQEVRHIMLPSLRPTTLVLLVLTIVNAFRSFDFIYVMTKGGPGTATSTLPFLGYQQAFVEYDFGRGAATSVLAVAMVLVLAVIYSRTVLKEEK